MVDNERSEGSESDIPKGKGRGRRKSKASGLSRSTNHRNGIDKGMGDGEWVGYASQNH